jgi:hypothetical protein
MLPSHSYLLYTYRSKGYVHPPQFFIFEGDQTTTTTICGGGLAGPFLHFDVTKQFFVEKK